MFHQYWCASSIQFARCKDNKEPMADVSNDIKEAVKQVYLADVEAIRNLSDVATKLNNKEGVTVPGNLTVSGAFNYLPKGTIVLWNGSSAPSGWTLCDGSYGSPNLRNKFVLGLGDNRLGAEGGESTVKLTPAQMPSHSHSGSGTTSSSGSHSHGFGVGGGGGSSGGGRGTTEGYTCSGCSFNTSTDAGGVHSHTFNVSTSTQGKSEPHNNMPPFYTLAYIMKL